MGLRTAKRGMLALAILALTAGVAPGQSLTKPSEGYAFFNKPGASVADHTAALIACSDATEYLVQPDASAGAGAGGGIFGALVAGIVKGVMQGIEARQGFTANMENCMTAHGWRVAVLPEAEGKAVADLPDQNARLEKLALLIGADAPGTIVRQYGNELANGPFVVASAGNIDKVSLSLQAVTYPEKEKDAKKTAAGKFLYGTLNKDTKAILPAKLGAIAADRAIIVVRITGPKVAVDASRINFARYDGAGLVSTGYGAPTTRVVVDKTSTEDFVFAVPAGEWALAGFGIGFGPVWFASTCFGAPSFALAPGEVVYAGAFELGKGGYRLSRDVDAGRTILASAPALAERVKAAAWENGRTFSCAGAFGYAYEIEDAPYRQDYALGSRAAKTIAPPALNVVASSVSRTEPADLQTVSAAPEAIAAVAPAVSP